MQAEHRHIIHIPFVQFPPSWLDISPLKNSIRRKKKKKNRLSIAIKWCHILNKLYVIRENEIFFCLRIIFSSKVEQLRRKYNKVQNILRQTAKDLLFCTEQWQVSQKCWDLPSELRPSIIHTEMNVSILTDPPWSLYISSLEWSQFSSFRQTVTTSLGLLYIAHF